MNVPYAVVMPARDAERTIGDAIDSLLGQTVVPAQIIVVDDGSRDATAAVARAYGRPVEVVTQPRRGPATATERALARVEVPFVAGLDADDVWFNDKATRQLDRLARDTALDGVFCHAAAFAHGSEPRATAPGHPLWGRSAMLLRYSSMRRMGPVRQVGGGAAGEMVDWIARARENGLRFALLPDVLVGRRRIAGSLMDGAGSADLLPAVRAAIERRRRAG